MAWVTVENQKLNYQQQNQKVLRVNTYIQEVIDERRRELAPRKDGIFLDDNQQPCIGRKILSNSFIVSLKWYNAKFQDDNL